MINWISQLKRQKIAENRAGQPAALFGYPLRL
jgi:hypothetical protein